MLADVLAPYTDAALLQLQALLEPFGIRQFYPDNWGADSRYLKPPTRTIGKTDTPKEVADSNSAAGSKNNLLLELDLAA